MVDESDWFVTITVPTPSELEDAEERFELEWRNARRQFTAAWDDDELERLDDLVGDQHHDEGEALVIVHARGGPTLIEPLDEPVPAAAVHEGPLPRWAAIIEARQRVLAHIVVETDRTGADLIAFDGGDVLASETVEGTTLHIHRGHPGGFSQRRFQQRAENTWVDNAHEVTEVLSKFAHDVDPELVAVAGDVRAQALVLESLPEDLAEIAIKIEAGSSEGIAAEVGRQVASLAAERVTEAAERVRAGQAHGTASVDTATVVAALRESRVDTLLVHDEETSADEFDGTWLDETWLDGARVVDRAIVAGLATDAEILVVPDLAIMEGPLAAIMRW